MNPIKISQSLQQTLVSYLTTTFDVNRDGKEPELAAMIRSSLNAPGALFNGPFLELTPPYKTARTLNEIIAEGVLSTELKNLPCFAEGRPIPLDAPLYTHQDISISRLVEDQRSIVVSSGTGSGKTECFTIPILNDLLLDDTPGVRALLVYPMNALVNDQLDRLRILLNGTSITFGRYTSELEQNEQEARKKLGFEPLPNEVICRDDIQSGKKIPQILITNYAMLEYLLLRPEDSKLFQSGIWRFIVLDEAHTYSGAQGIEVAMLMRRLKHRLAKQPGDMRCIATSATLTNNNAKAAAQFASDLFHEDIVTEDVIFGEINPDFAPDIEQLHDIDPEVYLHPDFEELLQVVRSEAGIDVEEIAIYMLDIGLITNEELSYVDKSNHNGAKFLWHVMRNNPHLVQLRNWMLKNDGQPILPSETAQHIFGNKITDDIYQLQALNHLIELGAIARENSDDPPLLPARYHLFARPPQGMWACINPNCSGRETSAEAGWSRLFSRRVEVCDACSCMVYPITVCRECGQVYLHMREKHRELSPAQDSDWDDSESRYFTWRPVRANYGLGDEIDEDDEVPYTNSSKLSQQEKELCVSCGQYEHLCKCEHQQIVKLWQVTEHTEKKKGKQLLKMEQPLAFMNQCPRCYSTAQRNTEIITPMTIAGTTPLTTITYEMYRQLPPSPKTDIAGKPGNGRKLLTFYDSRQGAARFAAFLQDTANQQNYRHIIPVAVRDIQEKEGYPPDLQDISKSCADIAWKFGIFHNDPDSQEWRKRSGKISRAQRKRMMEKTNAEIIAEFTTRRNARQSLETLGLIAVEYFEDEQEIIDNLDVLANQIGFTPQETFSLIHYLLDDLRKKKVVVLPEGVDRDDPVFGRHKFSPRLVRGGQIGQNEESWIGKTERKSRRRLIKKMLAAKRLPDSQNEIVRTLEAIWNWLIDHSDLFDGQPADGYQLREDRLFFNGNAQWYRCDNCLRLNAHGNGFPCPHPDCTGTMQKFDTTLMRNFYSDLFQREIIPLRVEEHTAQLDSVRGHEYQDKFRNGDINILSCSTTFEMGIDLGDLQAVSMSNVPPTVANYRQRAGRAGRRSSGTALILTWASNRPHDQTYFRKPSEIINGNVRVPYIALDNEFIRRRHINAILLSEFLRYRHHAGHEDLRRVGSFFDHQTTDEPHFSVIERWMHNRHEQIHSILSDFAPFVLNDSEENIDSWISGYYTELSDLSSHYQEITDFYLQRIKEAINSQVAGNRDENTKARDQADFYEKLLERLRGEYLINYLSDRGLLPSYSFPLHSVELLLPPGKDADHLRLQRDLRQAIREYAPGSEIVADKRIWRSAGIQFYRETPRTQEYQICHNCGHLSISTDPGKPLPNTNGECMICHEPYNTTSRRVQKFLTPDGFKADWKSGQPAKQYVISNSGKERSALIPPSVRNEQHVGKSMLVYDYQRDGKLLYVNEGRSSRGYKICFTCGSVMADKDKVCKANYKGKKCSGSRIEVVALGHVQQTDTLHIRFEPKPDVPIPSPDNSSFWLSLMYALINGASRALQIERRDIGGVLYPRQTPDGKWEQNIVLYDDVPGGAGHVKQISQEFLAVFDEALVILNCTDCDPETSCTHCLRDYSNQVFYDLLKRHEALRFLESVRTDFISSTGADDKTGAVIALNLPHWLMRQVENTHEQVYIAADEVSLKSPFGTSRTWTDILADLIQRGVETTLFIGRFEVKRHNPTILSIAQHLRLLMKRGLNLYWIDQLPEWQIIIDPNNKSNCRAIKASQKEGFYLDDKIGASGLDTTIHISEVFNALDSLQSTRHIKVSDDELMMPANIRVININNYEHKNTNEADLFGDIFTNPIKSLIVNDPYLVDSERILNRLGAYVDLAIKYGVLESIIIYTRRAGQRGIQGSPADQDRAFTKLEKIADCEIKRVFDQKKVEHDRYVSIERVDGSKARIMIGKGLDFIHSDGSVDPTYVVIQDPII
jgi:hypothetical protein